jgi:hypothetical protein
LCTKFNAAALRACKSLTTLARVVAVLASSAIVTLPPANLPRRMDRLQPCANSIRRCDCQPQAKRNRQPSPGGGALSPSGYVHFSLSCRLAARLSVTRIGKNLARVTSDYPRLPVVDVPLTVPMGKLLQAHGDCVFLLDCAVAPEAGRQVSQRSELVRATALRNAPSGKTFHLSGEASTSSLQSAEVLGQDPSLKSAGSRGRHRFQSRPPIGRPQNLQRDRPLVDGS